MATVLYNDVWEHQLLSHGSKLDWLEQGSEDGNQEGELQVERNLLDDFKPIPFQGRNWPSLDEIFVFKSSGIQTKRNGFVYSTSRCDLINTLQEFPNLEEQNASRQFKPTTLNGIGSAQAAEFEIDKVIQVSFRPLDLRSFYNHRSFVDRPRPALQECWGHQNVAMYSHTFGIGVGPACFSTSLLPDYDMLSGRGGYAFPLYDRRPGHGPANLQPQLIEGLSLVYSAPVTPEQAFDAMLALLSATSYTLRFAEDLEDVFPHIPFPADKNVFDRAVEVGQQIREVETFARAPDPQYLTNAMARVETTPRGALAAIKPGDWDGGELTLCADGSGRISGIPRHVWEFAVSGYRVLPRWLAGREGITVDDAFIRELRDIIGRINELIHRFDEADLVLQDALNHTLTKDELGL